MTNDTPSVSSGQDNKSKSKPKTKPKPTPPAPFVTIFLNGEKQRFRDEDLLDQEKLDNLREEITQSNQQVKVGLSRLPELSPDARITVLELLVDVENQCAFCVGSKRHEGLFAAILACIPGEDNLQQFGNAKITALEGAAMLYADAPELACKQISERLQTLGIKGVRQDRLANEVRNIQKQLSITTGDMGGEPVHSVLKDAPLPDDLILPEGYYVSQNEMRSSKGRNDGGTISGAVLISRRLVDADRQGEWLELMWKRDGKWKTHNVDRAMVASTRDIVRLASAGLPVTSNNAQLLVQYLADFEAANLERLPKSLMSQHMGWHGKDQDGGFLLGDQHIADEARACDQIKFHGLDGGDDQIAKAFVTEGTFKNWKNAVQAVAQYPIALLTLYTSFVPSLLPLLGADNFVINLGGPTTIGKTTTLRIAASVWGNPDERSSFSVIKTWDGTATFRERYPAVINNLPMILDDTKHVRNPEDIAKAIYGISGGGGRGRGSPTGIAAQQTCQTVLLTSGEQPMTSFTQDGGTRARSIETWGPPFGKIDSLTGVMVSNLNESVKANFGHAGVRFIKYLIKHAGQRGVWIDEYRTNRDKYRDWASAANNSLAGRMAPYFASIAVAARLAHAALKLPWGYSDPIESLWNQIVREAGEANRGAAALRHVMDWAVAHQADFYKKGGSEKQPLHGWAGRWNAGVSLPDGESSWTTIGFMRNRLDELLKGAGFEPESIIRAWQASGWLKVSKDKSETTRRTQRMRVGKLNVHLICILHKAVKSILVE